MYPSLCPLRSQDHVEVIIEAIKDGTIDCLSTDHAPHIEPEKIRPFQDAPNGTTGLETSFAGMITYLVDKKHISLAKGIELMSIGAAKIIQVDKGTLSVGADADIAIFDIKKEWTVDPNKRQSKGKNCVFNGKKLKGKALHVVVGGKIKMQDEAIVS